MNTIEKLTVGAYLQNVRKEKEITIDEIVRETNIPKSFIEAIEADNFSIFPAETYTIGFISNYAEFLELEKEKVVSMYKKRMQIEQDSPIEQLVGRKRSSPLKNILLFLIIIIVIAGFSFVVFFFSQNIGNILKAETYKSKNKPSTYIYNFNDVNLISTETYRLGDKILITNRDNTVSMTLNRIDSRKLFFYINNREYNLKAGGVLNLDLNNNGANDLSVDLYNLKEDKIKLSMVTIDEEAAAKAFKKDKLFEKYQDVILKETVLYETNQPGQMDLTLDFNGYGWVNYAWDNRQDLKDTPFQPDDALTISFEKNILISFANSGAVDLEIAGKSFQAGEEGDVDKSIIFWKTEKAKYLLVKADLK